MKQYAGDEIRRIMTEMPDELVRALQAAHLDEMITEYEARWWGFLQFARTGSYEGDTYTITVNGTGEKVTDTFLGYTRSVRLSDERAGLVRKPWPERGFARREG